MKHACQAGCGRTFKEMEDAEVHEESCQGEKKSNATEAAYGAFIFGIRGLTGFDRYAALMGACLALEAAKADADILEMIADERERLFRVLSGRS